MMGTLNNQKTVAYEKTVREIAEEIGVSKQAVFKKINRQPLSTKLEGLTSTVDGRLMVSVDGEKLIKEAFEAKNECEGRQPSTVNHQPAVNLVDGEVDGSEIENANKNQELMTTDKVHEDDSDDKSEVIFLRKQIEQMNDQLSRRDTIIDSLNKELEKEREHNREKDRQLMDTLTKLAETQSALAVGQSAEKQKALAETLIEGQQKMDDGEPRVEPAKKGRLRRILDIIAGKE